MSRTRHRRPARPTHRWFAAAAPSRCALNDHEVAVGTFMRTRIGDWRQVATCEECLRACGILRSIPQPRDRGSFSFNTRAKIDTRARQTGEDDER